MTNLWFRAFEIKLNLTSSLMFLHQVERRFLHEPVFTLTFFVLLIIILRVATIDPSKAFDTITHNFIVDACFRFRYLRALYFGLLVTSLIVINVLFF